MKETKKVGEGLNPGVRLSFLPVPWISDTRYQLYNKNPF